MQRIAAFEKVSEEAFVRDMVETFPGQFNAESASSLYTELSSPVRATKGSAGYDFKSTISFSLTPGESIKVPTGFRVRIEEGWFLAVVPRSSLGFKYRLQLANTIGIIDADYYHAANEGHIFIKITNDSKEGKTVSIAKGENFCQGIFLPFGITEDDFVDRERTGGLGSTN